MSDVTDDQIPGHLPCVGRGWWPLLTRLHTDLCAIEPGYRVGQLKEKFGELRLYLLWDIDSGLHPDMEDLIDAASGESRTVCEYCGNPGHIRQGRTWWYKAMCDECAGDEVHAVFNQAKQYLAEAKELCERMPSET